MASLILLMHHRIAIALTLLFTFPSFFRDLKAQSPRYMFEQYTIDDGLSMNAVTTIEQDHKGLMWFGNREGLNCWDGYQFTVYKHISDDPHSLRNNMINIIYEDSGLNFWIGTWKGLDLFDRKHNQFIHFDLGCKEELYITDILEDSEHNLWISTLEEGLKLLNRNDSTVISHFNVPENPEDGLSNQVHSIYEDKSGLLWIGTSNGLYQFNRKNGTFFKYNFTDLTGKTITEELFFSIYQDFEGLYWLTGKGWKGLSVYNPGTGTIKKIKHDPKNIHSLSDDRLSTICEDSQNHLWIGTQNGLNLFNRTNDLFYHYKHNPYDAKSISSNHIRHLVADRNGNLWIGTVGGGISLKRSNLNPFQNHTYAPDDQDGLSHPNVTSFFERKNGTIWIGTKEGGLNLFNPINNTFTHYQVEAQSKNTSFRNEIADNILEDRFGNLWIVAGTQAGEGGLHKYRMSDDGRRLLYFKEEIPGNLANETIWTVCEDSLGEIWIGGPEGIFRYNQLNGKLRHDVLDEIKGQTYKIFEDRRKNIWIGTKNGLYGYKRDDNSFTRLSTNTVYGMNEDLDGHIIVFEDNFIAYCYDPKKDTFTSLYDGTKYGPALGSLMDDSGHFWFNTRSGLIKLDPASDVIRHYDADDGLISNEFNAGAHLKSIEGLLYFGSINGFTVFHPDSIFENTHIPPVVFTDFRLFNQTVPVAGSIADTLAWPSPLEHIITYTTELELTHRQKLFSIEFAALNYLNPEENHYRYKLESFNEDWIYTDAGNRTATYTNLNPGRYQLIVMGSNNDGIWNEEGASLLIKVLPPPWRTWWAYTLYGLCIAGFLFGSIRFLLVRQHLKDQLELEKIELKKIQELDQMKTRFFANISHEFRTPLTLILGPLSEMINHHPNIQTRKMLSMMQRNGRRLLFLINQLLDSSKLEAGRMETQSARYEIIDFLKKVFASFESLALSRNIQYLFQTDMNELIVYFDRDKLEKVMVNLITNAFKFTHNGGEIFVKVKTGIMDRKVDHGAGFVEILVEDRGIGIAADQLPKIFNRYYQVPGSGSGMTEGSGIGLALAKDLINLHHGSLTVESEKGKGSVFTVRLPLGNKHLQQHEMLMETGKPDEMIPEKSPGTGRESKWTYAIGDGKCHLLIIDDNPDMRAYIREILGNEDVKITDAGNGEEGLHLAIENLPDLVVTDVMMPGMDGIDFCRKLKNDERTSHIPVLMLTAKAEEEARIAGFETGADDYISKPFSPDEFRIRIRNIIQQRKKLRERFSRDITLQPGDISITSADERFLQKALDILMDNASKSEFGSDLFAKEMALSRAQLHRKLKSLTNQSAREFIRSFRLNHARQLLEGHYGNMAEIAFESGFSNPSYFAECFKKQFGALPSEY